MFDKGKTKITGSKVEVFRVPTDAPEADGTYAWDSTTMVLVHLEAGGKTGFGYTYADESTAKLAHTMLQKVVAGRDVFSQAAILQDIYRHVRNLGETGITRMAAAAIDNAMWDLRARLLDVAASEPVWNGARRNSGVWERWLYLIQRHAVARSTWRLGATGILHGEDESRKQSGR